MAKARQTGSKRQRERTKQEQKQDKNRRKAARDAEREERRASVANGVDPDLVGIVAGPQPVVEEETDEAAAEGEADAPDESEKESS